MKPLKAKIAELVQKTDVEPASLTAVNDHVVSLNFEGVCLRRRGVDICDMCPNPRFS